MNWKTFFICGLTGWCMEILFTSLGGLLRGDLLLNGHTSIELNQAYYKENEDSFEPARLSVPSF